MSQLSKLTVAQLQRAIVIKKQIESLQEELELLNESNADVAPRRGRPKKALAVGAPLPEAPRRKKKRNVSAEEKARRSEAAKARWAKRKAKQQPEA